tara:strand:- start:503 stop:1504 length:1002 start_codon:yes stop_codon:yes gene_type:complete
MAEESDDLSENLDSYQTLKDKMKNAGEKMGDLSKIAAKKSVELGSNIAKDIKSGAKKTSEKTKIAAKKTSDKTKEVAKKASEKTVITAKKFGNTIEKKKEELKRKREEKNNSKLIDKNNFNIDDEKYITDASEVDDTNLLSQKITNNEDMVTISKSEYETLIKNNSIKEINTRENKNNSKKNNKKIRTPNESLTVELSKSLNEIMATLSVTIVFAALLVGAEYYLDNNPQKIGEFSIELLIWPMGTALWSFYILNKLASTGTFLKMPIGMRIQSAIGVGLATELALILATDTVVITNIWGWTAAVALTSILLSGIFRGMGGTFYKLFNRKEKF